MHSIILAPRILSTSPYNLTTQSGYTETPAVVMQYHRLRQVSTMKGLGLGRNEFNREKLWAPICTITPSLQ